MEHEGVPGALIRPDPPAQRRQTACLAPVADALNARLGCESLALVRPFRAFVTLIVADVLLRISDRVQHPLQRSPVCLFFPEGALQVQIINFNFEAVQVTWNRSEPPSGTNLTFFYTLSSDADGKQCPHYILQDDRTAGCVLEARKDEILCFSVGDGAAVLVQKCEWISAYLKPSSPRALTFRWHREAVTVSCSELPYKRLLYEVQFKSTFDTEWQTQEGETCNVTVEGLDAEKCYSFRARVKTMESSYGPDTYPSDWSEVTHQQRGEPRDSCPGRTLSSKLMLICGLVALLTACLLVLSLWKVRRLQKLLMPSVPDPKVTFPGLFECHQGNFQVTAAAGQSSRIPSSHPGSSAAAPQPPSAGCLLHPLFPETRASPL
ncbi:cytokine receptor-like factor 2 [Suricata suricatta]|uniref:cytokine receptor-like factor 2 n=1 Tax=Suricata suricatta TaxID=37032 RepID=UPI0011556DD1|nr:cytokine receptor-like factor 2 [Suricata suricatta]